MEQARAAWKQERDEIKEMCTKQHLWENGQEKDGSPKLAWKSSFLTWLGLIIDTLWQQNLTTKIQAVPKAFDLKVLDSWTPGPVSGGHLKELPEAAANEGWKTFGRGRVWSPLSVVIEWEVRSVWYAGFRVKWGRGCPNAGPFLEFEMIEPIHRR